MTSALWEKVACRLCGHEWMIPGRHPNPSRYTCPTCRAKLAADDRKGTATP
jgi:hypothetical protein